MNIIIKDSAEFISAIKRGGYSRVVAILDDNTLEHCWSRIKAMELDVDDLIIITPGEEHKTIDACQQVWEQMTQLGLDRHALVINVGGGVVTDLGGFCAASYKRGIDFIHVPTSLLGMVDAAIGGKTGVDFQGFKNQIGVFAEPSRIWIQPEFLETLPDLEWVSGYAEIYKHALINDRDLFNQLNKLTKIDTHIDWTDIIWRAIHIKDQIVQRDPLEKYDRKALNYGHTIGHGIESLRLEQGRPIPHGWAVAMGMICESYLSTVAGYLAREDLDLIGRHIMGIFNCRRISHTDYQAIYNYCLGDKKNRNGQILCTLIGPIGNFKINQPIDADQIYSALNYYNGIVSDYT